MPGTSRSTSRSSSPTSGTARRSSACHPRSRLLRFPRTEDGVAPTDLLVRLDDVPGVVIPHHEVPVLNRLALITEIRATHLVQARQPAFDRHHADAAGAQLLDAVEVDALKLGVQV